MVVAVVVDEVNLVSQTFDYYRSDIVAKIQVGNQVVVRIYDCQQKVMENVAVDDIVVVAAAVAVVVVEVVLMKVKMIYQLVDFVVDIVADNY